jgi:ADP-ribose pyrophosphatase YjhB (NUDIX family)
MSAVIREVWEEGGVEAAVDGLLGIQELPEPQDGGVALVYLCKHAGGDLVPRDRETDAARYYTQRALDALSEAVEPWSNWLVRRHFAGALTITHRDQTNPLQAHGAFL